MKNILVIMGPNLNMIGVREKEIYGQEDADSIDRDIVKYAKQKGIEVEIFQSNSEGDIIDKIHTVSGRYDGVVINAGAYTHYSYAIRDAISCVKIVPFVEVHMSNIYAREEFRHKSVISSECIGQIAGFGKNVYTLAIEALMI